MDVEGTWGHSLQVYRYRSLRSSLENSLHTLGMLHACFSRGIGTSHLPHKLEIWQKQVNVIKSDH